MLAMVIAAASVAIVAVAPLLPGRQLVIAESSEREREQFAGEVRRDPVGARGSR